MRLQVPFDCPLSPRKRVFNFTTVPRGERARVRGQRRRLISGSSRLNQVNPLIRPAATFSPDLGGEGTCERLPVRI